MFRRLMRLALGAALIAACTKAPSDARLRQTFSEHRVDFQRLCDTFPSLGADAIGRGDSVRLAARGRLWFEPVSDEVLREAGIERAAYSLVVDTLERLDALAVEAQGAGVSIIMQRAGVVPSSSSTWVECNPQPPAATAPDSARSHSPHGRHCAALEGGWWICREWS